MNLELLKQTVKVYINPQSVEFLALVSRVDPMHEGLLDLIFLNQGAVNTVFSIPRQTSPERDENNPELPRYPINCWKDVDEDHKALPADHAAFDHPFEEKKKDAVGNIVEKERPLHAQDIFDHKASMEQVPLRELGAPADGQPLGAVGLEEKAANDAATPVVETKQHIPLMPLESEFPPAVDPRIEDVAIPQPAPEAPKEETAEVVEKKPETIQ